MTSIVGEVLEYIESSVQTALPGIQKSRHYFNFSKNDSVKNNYIFAVRPGNANSVNGTLRSVTMSQDFEIEISRDYIENSSDDLPVRRAIDAIYADNEKILKEISLRKTTVVSILAVKEPSYSTPVINENTKSVSITFTYPVTYRKAIKGD